MMHKPTMLPPARLLESAPLRLRARICSVGSSLHRRLPWIVAVAVSVSGVAGLGLVLSALGNSTETHASFANYTGTLSEFEAPKSSEPTDTTCLRWTYAPTPNICQYGMGAFGMSGRVCFLSHTLPPRFTQDEWCTPDTPCANGIGKPIRVIPFKPFKPEPMPLREPTFEISLDGLIAKRQYGERKPAER